MERTEWRQEEGRRSRRELLQMREEGSVGKMPGERGRWLQGWWGGRRNLSLLAYVSDKNSQARWKTMRKPARTGDVLKSPIKNPLLSLGLSFPVDTV